MFLVNTFSSFKLLPSKKIIELAYRHFDHKANKKKEKKNQLGKDMFDFKIKIINEVDFKV